MTLIVRDLMRIVGVDEAGRGPVLGPLVVGILSIPKADEDMLVEQDISDSNIIQPRNERANMRILQQAEECDWYVDTIVCPPNKIDNAVYGQGLNLLEAELFVSQPSQRERGSTMDHHIGRL